MSEYENFDSAKFIMKIGQLSRENQIKVGIMIKNDNTNDITIVKKEIIKEYSDGLRFRLEELNRDLLDRLINFVERLDSTKK